MKQTIEQLAEKLILVEPTDLIGLAEVHTLLEEVARGAAQLSAQWAGPLTMDAAQTIQGIVLNESPDPVKALEHVAAAVKSLEQLVLGGRDASEIALPEGFAAQVSSTHQPDSPSAGAAVPSSTEPESETQEHAAASDNSTDSQTIKLTGDPELTADFVIEARDHLDTANESLLAIEADPDNTDMVNTLFRSFHTIKGVAGFLDLHDVMHLAHQTENLLDAARQGRFKLQGARLDAVFDATDMMTRLIGFVGQAIEGDGTLRRDTKQEALIARLGRLNCDGPVDDDHAGRASQNQEETIEDSTEAQDAENSASEEPRAAGSSGSIKMRDTVKVDSSRLDVMIDAIGELVIAEAMVSQSPELRSVTDDAMHRRLSHLSKITRELQEMATSLRLMPVRATFQRMARLARDTAKKLNKRIEFITSGDETELDKNVVDQIGDPLVHMVRNAVDHGLEDSEADRIAAGKSAIGKVELKAYHKGGSIYIEISDDGKGLDRERILAKAIERGLVREDQKLSEQEINLLIMEPGFSTAKVVSDVSGRGVGMDVVRKNIQKMRGQIEIHTSAGKGTTFLIRLPLTLAIIDGMVVRVGGHRYVIPLLSILRMLRPDEGKIPTVFNQAEMLQTDEGLIPLYRIHRLFSIADAKTDPTQASVVVVEHEGKRIGLLIDELLGQQQIVIKSLGESLRGVEGIAGGAIMPDGKVGLILDLDSLIRLACSSRGERTAA